MQRILMVFKTQVIVAVKLKFVLELQMICSWKKKKENLHILFYIYAGLDLLAVSTD